MKLELIRENKLVFLCFLIAIIFLFKNLDNIYMWSDEANSALVSKNILKYGYPSNFDGRNIVQHYWLYDGVPKLSPFYRTTTWLHLYLAAISFKLLGTNTFAARFPSALVGLGIIICLFLFLREFGKDKFITNTSVVLLTFCVPFYLHMRQCRYYSLATLFTLLGIWGYLEFYLHGRKPKFIIYSLLLFLSMHSAFLVLMLGVAVHFLVFYKRERVKELFISWAWMGVVTLPVIIFLKLWERPPDLLGWENRFNIGKVYERFFRYLLYFNDYLIPFALLAIYLIWRLKRRELTRERFKNNPHLSLMIILLVVAIVFMALVAPHKFRLIVPYVPLALILLSYILRYFKQRTNSFAAIFLVLILISSNFIHQLPHCLGFITGYPPVESMLTPIIKRIGWYNDKMKTYWKPGSIVYNYLYEITHDYDGPNEGISRYLNQHAGKDDTVKVAYGDYIYQFYTKSLIIPRGQFENEIIPDWFIFRGPRWDWKGRLTRRFKDILARDYERIVIDYPELPWGNLPEPDYHKFKTVTDAPRVVIYRRKK